MVLLLKVELLDEERDRMDGAGGGGAYADGAVLAADVRLRTGDTGADVRCSRSRSVDTDERDDDDVEEDTRGAGGKTRSHGTFSPRCLFNFSIFFRRARFSSYIGENEGELGDGGGSGDGGC